MRRKYYLNKDRQDLSEEVVFDYNEMNDPCKVWWENSTDSRGRMILFVRKTAKKDEWSSERRGDLRDRTWKFLYAM